MILRLALFGLIALVVAGFGAVAWITLRPAAPVAAEAEAPPPPPAKITVLVAGRPLHAGSLLKPEDVTAHEFAVTDVPAGARPDTTAARAELCGAMIRRSLLPDEVLLPGDVMRPGDHGFLAAVLAAGARAVSVGVDAVSGAAGLIWPGDRVDLILTQMQDETGTPAGKRVSGETVLRDVRVIAIDQQLVQGGGAASLDSQTARTVTLEVTPQQAERVAVATRLGHLALVVRASAPDDATTTTAQAAAQAAPDVTWGSDVSTALRQGRGSDGGSMRVFQGAADSKEFRF